MFLLYDRNYARFGMNLQRQTRLHHCVIHLNDDCKELNFPTIASRDISQVDLEACLMFFKDSNGSIKNSINGKTIRIEMYNPISPNLLPVLKEWSRDLDKNDIDWC